MKCPKAKFNETLRMLEHNAITPSVRKDIVAYLKKAKRLLLNQPLVLCLGDTARYEGKRHKGKETVICKTVICEGGTVEYATLEGAWFKHSELLFLKGATPASLKLVAQAANPEYDLESKNKEW